MQGGINHSESNPRFHQQMVYAVASRHRERLRPGAWTVRELSSELKGGKPRPDTVVSPRLQRGECLLPRSRLASAILFGYFRAARDDPWPIVPGRSCFSRVRTTSVPTGWPTPRSMTESR